MPSISDTIAQFQRFRRDIQPTGGTAQSARLVQLDDFGDNPGNLNAWIYCPPDLSPGAPLVVVLHGCTQTADAYDRGSGWSTLADRFGFALLYPEQRRANNSNLCFNWFVAGDMRRDGGEAESIAQMVATVVARHRLDASRLFVTGLSAGGAMASVMLATRPEMFAGGAIIAGLPYGTATGLPEALERMRGRGHDDTNSSARVRAASGHRGPWPSVAVWHGTADTVVSATNAAAIVDQWRGLHGAGAPDVTKDLPGHRRRAWHDRAGRVIIEDYLVAGLGHGTPIATAGDEACGIPGPHMLDAGVSSTYRIAASWGIVPPVAPKQAASPVPATDTDRRPSAVPAFDPGRAIGDALRAAGLM